MHIVGEVAMKLWSGKLCSKEALLHYRTEEARNRGKK